MSTQEAADSGTSPPTPTRRIRDSKLASRLVQAGFVIGLVYVWYIATNYFKINPILLPNPVNVYHELVDVIVTLEFVDDLRVTLTELLSAFAISSTAGITLGYLISRSQY